MAHFAKLNDKNIVEEVVVLSDNDCGGGVFPQSDATGNTFLNSIGLTGNWKQTSYNSRFRKHYAGIGYFYDEQNDAFISEKPYPSWILNEDFVWIPPTPEPKDGKYIWDEELLNWKLID